MQHFKFVCVKMFKILESSYTVPAGERLYFHFSCVVNLSCVRDIHYIFDVIFISIYTLSILYIFISMCIVRSPTVSDRGHHDLLYLWCSFHDINCWNPGISYQLSMNQEELEMLFYHMQNCRGMMVIRIDFLHNGNAYTGMTISMYRHSSFGTICIENLCWNLDIVWEKLCLKLFVFLLKSWLQKKELCDMQF